MALKFLFPGRFFNFHADLKAITAFEPVKKVYVVFNIFYGFRGKSCLSRCRGGTVIYKYNIKYIFIYRLALYMGIYSKIVSWFHDYIELLNVKCILDCYMIIYFRFLHDVI